MVTRHQLSAIVRMTQFPFTGQLESLWKLFQSGTKFRIWDTKRHQSHQLSTLLPVDHKLHGAHLKIKWKIFRLNRFMKPPLTCW